MNLDNEVIRAIVNDFENCGIHGGCENCRCYEKLNSTQCNICDLLLTYRKDITDKITELVDRM